MKDHLKALIRGHDPLRARNVVREYLEARALRAMQRAGAMTALAFQGGTCLRFLFSLPRYSEDLNFALEGDRTAYALPKYLKAIRAELATENYRVELRLREHRTVHGAFDALPRSCSTTWACLRTARKRWRSRSKSTRIPRRAQATRSAWCADT